ncbi:hypothetical protein [Paenibacillus odorifer]|uniref:hypothetical protein n=1 Tax=Paenibacillus odorifer TaxID=189426 RepID=UPI00117D2F61|nr:hypothetical protein [Paenibacillus odorifer]
MRKPKVFPKRRIVIIQEQSSILLMKTAITFLIKCDGCFTDSRDNQNSVENILMTIQNFT